MSTLTRNDGTQFVIQAYRESIREKKKSRACLRIKKIAEQQGHFVRFFKPHTDELEAVFSSEPGYLLGESIKQYFQHEKNLIFCERLSDSTQLLLIIVKEGSVFTDTLIDEEQLKTELLPLTSLKIKFKLVTTTGTPLSSPEDPTLDTQYCFPPELTQSFEYLNSPLFPRLPTPQQTHLLPLPVALKAAGLRTNPLQTLTLTLLIFLCLVTAILLDKRVDHTNLDQQAARQTLNAVTPHKSYLDAMKSPAPDIELDRTVSLLTDFYTLNGWRIHSFSLTNQTAIAEITPEEGDLTALRDWAHQNQFTLILQPQGIILTQPLQIPARSSFPPLTPLLNVTINFIDLVTHRLTDTTINILHTASRGDCHYQILQIKITQLSPEELDILSQLLHQQPAVLNSVNLAMNKQGLFTGTINLSLWGT